MSYGTRKPHSGRKNKTTHQFNNDCIQICNVLLHLNERRCNDTICRLSSRRNQSKIIAVSISDSHISTKTQGTAQTNEESPSNKKTPLLQIRSRIYQTRSSFQTIDDHKLVPRIRQRAELLHGGAHFAVVCRFGVSRRGSGFLGFDFDGRRRWCGGTFEGG